MDSMDELIHRTWQVSPWGVRWETRNRNCLCGLTKVKMKIHKFCSKENKKNHEGRKKTAEDVRKGIAMERQPCHWAPLFVSSWTQPSMVPSKRQFCKQVTSQGDSMVTRRQVETVRSSACGERHAVKGSPHLVLRTKRDLAVEFE